MSKDKLEKMIFVRRFIRLKRAMCFADNDPDYKKWVTEMLKEVADDGADDSDDTLDQLIFQTHIEEGEQGKINRQRTRTDRSCFD